MRVLVLRISCLPFRPAQLLFSGSGDIARTAEEQPQINNLRYQGVLIGTPGFSRHRTTRELRYNWLKGLLWRMK
jgi:hypothetical protein